MSQPQDPNQLQDDQQAYQQAEYQAQYAQQQVAQEQAPEEELSPESPSNSNFLLFRAIPSWGVSLVLHTAILVILGLVILNQQANSQPSMVSSLSTDDLIDEIFEEEILEPIDTPVEVAQEVTPDLQMSLDPVEEVTDSEPVEVADDVEAAIADVELVEFGDKSIPDVNLTDSVSTVTGTGLAGRGSQSRAQMVKQYGGTKESEAAVAEALKWFARHQLPNGAWSFDHQKGQCQGRCGIPVVWEPPLMVQPHWRFSHTLVLVKRTRKATTRRSSSVDCTSSPIATRLKESVETGLIRVVAYTNMDCAELYYAKHMR